MKTYSYYKKNVISCYLNLFFFFFGWNQFCYGEKCVITITSTEPRNARGTIYIYIFFFYINLKGVSIYALRKLTVGF